MMKKLSSICIIVCILICTVSISIIPSVHAQAVAFNVTPSLSFLSLSAGNTETVAITLKNHSTQTLSIAPSIQEFTVTGLHGNVTYQDISKRELQDFIYSNKSFSISPDKSTLFHLTITLSSNTDLGGMYDAVIFEAKAIGNGGNIVSYPRVASLLFIAVQGNAHITARLHAFSIGNNDVIFTPTIHTSVIAQNTGNVHITPILSLYINDHDFGSYERHTLLPQEQLQLQKSVTLQTPFLFSQEHLDVAMINGNTVLAKAPVHTLLYINLQHSLLCAFITIVCLICFAFLLYTHIPTHKQKHIA